MPPLERLEDAHVLLVDAGAFVHRYVHDGQIPLEQPGPSVMRRMLEDLVAFGRRAPMARAVLVFDGSRGWRKELFGGYKAKRKDDKFRGAAIVAFRYLERRFDELAVPYLRVGNVEADDLLSILAARCREAEVPAVVVSEDGDLTQCVGPTVGLYRPLRDEFLTADVALERWFGSEYLFRTWKALAGDKSDDLGGMEGIGEKRAAELIDWLWQTGLPVEDLLSADAQRTFAKNAWYTTAFGPPDAAQKLTDWMRLVTTATTIDELCPPELANVGGWWLVPGQAAAALAATLRRLAEPAAPIGDAWGALRRDADLWNVAEDVCLRVLGFTPPPLFAGAPPLAFLVPPAR